MMGIKILSNKEYEEINEKIKKCIDLPNRDEEIKKIGDEIENNIVLIGATALEDKL